MAFLQISTANPLGKRPLNFMALHQAPPTLLGWLGDVPGDLATAVATGALSQSDADTLSILGVTDAQVVGIINGTDTFESVMFQIGTGQSSAQLPQPAPVMALPLPSSAPASIVPLTAPAPSTATPSPASTASAAAPQIPSGSTIVYTVQWTASLLHPLTGASDAAAALQSQLPAKGMTLISSTTNSLPVVGGVTGYSVTFTILDTRGNALVSDAQGILDSLMRGIVGNNLTGSSISGVYAPGSGGGITSAAGATGITAWIEKNAGWAALVLVAVVAAPALIRKL